MKKILKQILFYTVLIILFIPFLISGVGMVICILLTDLISTRQDWVFEWDREGNWHDA